MLTLTVIFFLCRCFCQYLKKMASAYVYAKSYIKGFAAVVNVVNMLGISTPEWDNFIIVINKPIFFSMAKKNSFNVFCIKFYRDKSVTTLCDINLYRAISWKKPEKVRINFAVFLFMMVFIRSFSRTGRNKTISKGKIYLHHIRNYI